MGGKATVWLCRFLLLFVLYMITDAENETEILNQSHGKVYFYFQQTGTRDQAVKICKTHNMNLLSVEQHVEKNWLEKILGKLFYGDQDGRISSFVCVKDYASRINEFTRYAALPFKINEISTMTGNRMECAVECSGVLPCDIFTYESNICRFYSKGMGSQSNLPCNRLQCYVKIDGGN